MLPRLADAGWRVVSTRRADEPPLGAPERRLELGPLPTEALRSAVLAHPEAAALPDRRIGGIVERAAGNPRFAFHLLHLPEQAGLPPTIERTAAALIDSLPPDARLVIRQAAAAGPEADLA